MIKCDIILFIYIFLRFLILTEPVLIVPLSIISYLGVNKYMGYLEEQRKEFYGLEQ